VFIPRMTALFVSSHLLMCPLCSMFKIRHRDEQTGKLTNKIAGDGLVLLNMIAQVRYGGEHIKFDLVRDSKSGLVELGRHRKV